MKTNVGSSTFALFFTLVKESGKVLNVEPESMFFYAIINVSKDINMQSVFMSNKHIQHSTEFLQNEALSK